jgi:non-heme chloroperoxidase
MRLRILPAIAVIMCACTEPRRASNTQLTAADSVKRAEESTAAWNAPWQDPSPHKAGFVGVGDGVRLHYLDWGGSGETIILLTGFGLSAHIYDDLAPKLADSFHVVALTRRGHGESDHPDSGYGIDTAVEDIRHLLDQLALSKVILVGHSHGGWELSRFAERYPDRVSRIVYLDGTLDASTHEAMQSHEPVKRPAADYSTPATTRAWSTRYFYGVWTQALEADMRHYSIDESKWAGNTADWVAKPANYSKIRAPALAIYELATMRSRYFWLDTLTDRARSDAAQKYLVEWLNPWQQKGVDQFVRDIPNGRTVRIAGSHYLFITNEAEVVTAMKEFLQAKDGGVAR